MTTITKNKLYKEYTDGSFEETINETIVDNSDDRVFELEKQLHEQYAVNNNSNAGILISLISALLISFTGYGYVLYQYSIGECAIGIVNVAAIAVILVMVLLYCISVNLGAGQRMEQFITIAIRKKHYGESNKYEEIFPDGYHPFNKSYCTFVQGLYNTWSIVTLLTILGIMSCHLIIVETYKYCPVVISGLICVVVCIAHRFCRYKKYKKREHSVIESFKEFLRDVIDDRKSFSLCSVACNIAIIAFIIISIWFIVMAYFCGSHKDIDKQQTNIVKIKLNNSEPIKIQIID